VNKPKRPKTGGRAAGTSNKTTILAREAIALFVDGNAHRLAGWLDQIAEDPKQGPKAAFDCFMDVVEYHVPKLARTELTGKDGSNLFEVSAPWLKQAVQKRNSG
jgi:hypothetical protein